MPYLHIALAKLYISSNGAPWAYPKWQESTGIRQGLFPVQDEMLPHKWTRSDANEVLSYLRTFATKSSSVTDRKLTLHGRKLWVKFCSQIWRTLDIHSIIAPIICENIHLVSGSVRDPELVFTVGIELFGNEASEDIGRLDPSMESLLIEIISWTWTMLRTLHKRALRKAYIHRKVAIESFNSKLSLTCVLRSTEPQI